MAEISTNKEIRREQFRTTAKEILQRADRSWTTTDRVGQLATAMEQAYVAGAKNIGKPMDDVVVDGVVRWDAIPSRSRQVLEVIGITIKLHHQALLDGRLKAIIEGAAETARRGERAHLGYWTPIEDGKTYERSSDPASDYECASSSVSGLVRLGLFKPMKTDVPEIKPAELTELGLRTIINAIDAGHIYAPDWALGSATQK